MLEMYLLLPIYLGAVQLSGLGEYLLQLARVPVGRGLQHEGGVLTRVKSCVATHEHGLW